MNLSVKLIVVSEVKEEVPDNNGSTIIYPITLIPLNQGSVKQLIEISIDEGHTWKPTLM